MVKSIYVRLHSGQLSYGFGITLHWEYACSTSYVPALRRAGGKPSNFLHRDVIKYKFTASEAILDNFQEKSTFSSFFQHFGEEAAGFKQRFGRAQKLKLTEN